MTARASVIVPVLNGEKFIEAALLSVLDQLDALDEVIVADNGSTDATLDRVDRLADGRIRVLHQSVRGPAAARNMGLSTASGEFIAFLDHDDLWPSGRHEALLSQLENEPGAAAGVGRLRIRFEAGEEANLVPLDGLILDNVLLGLFLFRRTTLDLLGPIAEGLIFGEDLDYLMRLRESGLPVTRWDGDALIYRRHETNMTRNGPAVLNAVHVSLRRHILRKRQLT